MIAGIWASALAWLAPRWAAIVIRGVPIVTLAGLLALAWAKGDVGTKAAAALIAANAAIVTWELARKTPH